MDILSFLTRAAQLPNDLRLQRAQAEANEMALQRAKFQQSAQSKLYGGIDPLAANGGRAPGGDYINWNPTPMAGLLGDVDQPQGGLLGGSQQIPSQVMALASQAHPEAAAASMQRVLFPPAPEIGMGKPGEMPYFKTGPKAGQIAGEGIPALPDAWKPKNMQRPGTDSMVLARTPEQYDYYAGKGFVEAGTSVPGAKAPVAPKDPPKDYQVGPDGSAVMVPGGSAAVARAENIVKPIIAERAVYNDAANQYATMADLANDNTGASDISLGYTFFKVQDPQSTVREGEFALIGEKMGLPQWLTGQLNSLATGKGFLTKEARQYMVDTAGRSLKQRKAGLRRNYNDVSKALEPLKVDRRTFLPFSVTDVDIDEVKKQFADAQLDTAGRPYVVRDGKRMFIEVDD